MTRQKFAACAIRELEGLWVQIGEIARVLGIAPKKAWYRYFQAAKNENGFASVARNDVVGTVWSVNLVGQLTTNWCLFGDRASFLARVQNLYIPEELAVKIFELAPIVDQD